MRAPFWSNLYLIWASLVAQLVKNPPSMRETWVLSLGWEDSPGERKGYPLQYSGVKNSMDCIVHGVAKNRTQLSDFHLTSFMCICHFIHSFGALLSKSSFEYRWTNDPTHQIRQELFWHTVRKGTWKLTGNRWIKEERTGNWSLTAPSAHAWFFLLVGPLASHQLRAADNPGATGPAHCSVTGSCARGMRYREEPSLERFCFVFAELRVGFVPTPGGSKNLRESHVGWVAV